MNRDHLLNGARRAPIGLLLALVACSSQGAAPTETIGRASSAIVTNGGFETGTAGQAPPAWTVSDLLNPDPSGVTIQSPQTLAGLNLLSVGPACTTNADCVSGELGTCQSDFCRGSAKTILLASSAGPGTQPDALLGATASLRWPRYGNQCAVVNQAGSQSNVNELSQTMTVGAADVDPSDGQFHVRMTIAPVLEDPGHPANEQPYYFVQVNNVTRGTVLYSFYGYSNETGVPWQTVTTSTTTYRYTTWQLVDVAAGSPAINLGDMVQVAVYAAGCSLGGHEGELYVDGVGSTIPGIFVSGSAPSEINAGSNLTYALKYANGSASGETGVAISFTTPANTTFQSLIPPPGATCTSPAVGTAGTVTCSFPGTVGAGQAGTFSVTVNVAGGTTGSITLGSYAIASTQEAALLGNVVTTAIGCTADAQCSGGQWCDETTASCAPPLVNGTALPLDPPHTNPTLNGTCTAAAGALVCLAGVCDAADSECGYRNGDGPCTVASGGTVCRSGACDVDEKCGYANGDGPCTSANASVVCRSGACSANGTCEPLGGCDVDADCATGSFCTESTHACTPTLANGSPIPSDPAHTNPPLNGTCTSAAGALVCTSGVCDVDDNACGYASGDGPCTPANASVCRSGACSANGTCEPAGGCDVDADCAPGSFCLEATHVCAAQLANGSPIPTDPPHASPTLNGACTAPAGALVCASGVCDVSDNDCGYANGDGPCTAANSGVVCRSGACSADGVCVAPGGCNVDADCAGNEWCDESTHVCSAKVANGTPVPTDPPHTNPTLNGTCTRAAAALACASGVCDVIDNACGYANGDGACSATTAATVCRSGACSVNGVCEPVGGCNVDADCGAAMWCSESAHTCQGTLPNGEALPTDAPHTNPTLNGVCTAAAAALVCASGVCDVSDNACGYANGDGACTASNAAAVCRSAFCGSNGKCAAPTSGSCTTDAACGANEWCKETTHKCTAKLNNGSTIPTDAAHTNPVIDATCTTAVGAVVCASGVCDPTDNKCGYANNDGACTPATSTIVCRSGACSADGACEPAGGCEVDADCTAGKWCKESSHTCAATLANGATLPTDAAHTNPTLNGLCTTAAAALVCASGACDVTDNKCGYANGDGACTAASATVCRSGACSVDGVCEPAGGCEVDADCPAGKWCKEASHVCAATLANGAAIPTDVPHTSPTLNGTCTTAAAGLVCASGVCDATDGKCGYANNDGSCTTTTASVCRSGVCSADGVCRAASGCEVDADCAAGKWCKEATHACAATLGKGGAMPSDPPHTNPTLNGTCTTAAAALVCASGACSPSTNKCE